MSHFPIRCREIVIAVVALLLSHPAVAHDQASARYLGNAGVLVQRGETKVLFDAFYRQSYGTYTLVDDDTNAALLAGKPPFDGIDALLVSHAHGDHFSPEPTIAYMKAQTEVVLYGSTQVRDAIAKTLDGAEPNLLSRVVAIDLENGGAPARVEYGDLKISAVVIPHAGGERHASTINLAFRVAVDDQTTALHLGDADPDDRHFAPLQDYWDETELDVAFPPVWFYDQADGPRILRERLKAKQTIGVHVPAAAAGNGNAWRVKLGGDLFSDPGEIRTLNSPNGSPTSELSKQSPSN